MSDIDYNLVDMGDGDDGGQPAEPAPGEGAKPEKGEASKADDRLKVLEEELAHLRRSNQELQETNRYFRERAPAAAADDDSRAGEDDEDEGAEGLPDDNPEKLTEDLTREGMAALKRRGFVSQREAKAIARETGEKIARKIVNEALEGTIRQVERNTVLLTQYPDLNDKDSELARLASKYFAADVAEDPALKTSQTAFRRAVQTAAAELGVAPGGGAAGGKSTRKSGSSFDEERRARAARQTGDTKKPGRERQFSDEGDGGAVRPEHMGIIGQMMRGVEDWEKKFEVERRRTR